MTARCALLFFLFLAAGLAQGRMVLDGVVAVVDKDIILFSDLNEITRITLAQEKKPVEDTALFNEMRKLVLQRIVDDRVLLSHAKEESVTVSNDEIEERLNAQLEAMIQQAGSKEALDKELAKQYGLSIAKLKKQFRKDIEEQLVKLKFRESLFQKTKITNEEVEKFYADNKDSLPLEQASICLSHIMLSVKPGQDAQKRALDKIESAKERLAKGESFEKVAVSLSEDPSAKDSGDLGYISRGSIGLPEFENAAFALNVGEVSAAIKSSLGYHLIKVTGKKDRQIRVRHILVLIKPSEDLEKAVKLRLDSLRAAIKDSAGFARAAQEVSEDANTGSKGGYLGWYTKERLSAEYYKAISTLKPGEISEPVKVENAYHLFRLNNATEGRPLNLADDYDTIQKMAVYDKIKSGLENNIKQWRSNCHIELYLAEFGL